LIEVRSSNARRCSASYTSSGQYTVVFVLSPSVAITCWYTTMHALTRVMPDSFWPWRALKTLQYMASGVEPRDE
jgi:hypothetical protein